MVFKQTMFLLLLLLLLLLQHLALASSRIISGYHHRPYKSLLTDKSALLSFKNAIIHDPNSTLANWNEASDKCNFTGVRCDKHRHRVVTLVLNNQGLVGKLSPFISNLTSLRILELINNHFFSTIPPEISALRHLRHISLQFNNLHGSIPESFANLSNLTLVNLLDNKLNGTLPPSFFSNCSILDNVDLSNNFFTGLIPKEVGNCPNLWTLNLYNNQFTGELPFSLVNTSMSSLDVEYNNLSGELPAKMVRYMPFLQYLHLSNNRMQSHDGNTNLDPFFAALVNCTSLEELELYGMGLGGRLQDSVGKLSVNLKTFLLQENRISGSVPRDLAKLPNLMVLNLSFNLLSGTISAEINRLPKLEQLWLSYNLFTSTIPAALGRFPHLGLLDLSHNQFSGEISSSIGNLSQLNYLFLNNNNLSGAIPSTLGQCTALHKLDLSFNMLTGKIPPEILGLREIRIFINFSHNRLEGNMPLELSKLENVQEMDLSSNNLTGTIFPQISSCIALRIINFSNNALQGHLPDSLGYLKNLECFDVSRNRFTGMIPVSLNQIHTLTFLNLSLNDFEGEIPTGGIFNSTTNLSFFGNRRLCGGVSGMHSCSSKRNLFRSRVFLIIFSLVIFISSFLSIVCCVIAFRHLKTFLSSPKIDTVRKQRTPEPIHTFPRITYRELSKSTGGFDEQRIIGSGSYGRVYKGILQDGTIIAVKVLNVQSGNSTKSFNRECQVLKRIRHRNLIRIITACSLPDFKALVLPYMANGSLDNQLYPPWTSLASGSLDLSLIQRVNICSDIAEGMAYLHHHSPVRVVHCDLKPSNVLLNDNMTALVSDFGIARLVMTVGGGNGGAVENMGNSTANMLCGSVGYIPPEYGYGSNTSTKGDVYSFGVLVLEMVTRKRPKDDMFSSGLSLHGWVTSHYHGRVEKIVDSSLLRASRDQSHEVKKMWQVAIGELIELGILCTQESPTIRPTMLDAADDLDRLKRYLRGDTTATFASSLGISSSTLDGD